MSGSTGTRHPISFLLQNQAQDGQAAGSYTLSRLRDAIVSLDTGFLLAANYGVKADGTTNDTAAWNTVLTAAATFGATGKMCAVMAPPGVSNITQITVPAGCALFGHPVSTYPINNGGTMQLSGGSVFKQIGGATAAAITLATANVDNTVPGGEDLGTTLAYVGIIGDSTHSCITQSPAPTQRAPAYINEVVAVKGLHAFDGSAVSTYGWVIITNSTFNANVSDAILAMVDSRVSNCFIAMNGGDGIALTYSASSNNIDNNRIEYNSGYGVRCGTGDLTTITGNTFDANGKASIYLNGCKGIAVTGNGFRRSGHASTAGSVDDCHFRLIGNTNICITGNSTEADAQDGTGVLVPGYTLGGGANTSGVIGANALGGYRVALNNPTAPSGLTMLAGSNAV